MVTLSNLWFGAIGVLFTGFLFLEGFDFGVGALLPFLAKNDEERRIVINTIGPVWDGNEVWLLTAGGAMFAAFPYWYATMFSGFYLALFAVLGCLIIRGVTFEFRHQIPTKKWGMTWDWALAISSFLCTILFPVAFANLIAGTPLDMVNGKLEFVGSFFSLLTPYTIFIGVTGAAFFVYHGCTFIALKASGRVLERSIKLGPKLGLAAFLLTLCASLFSALKLGYDKPISVLALLVTLLALGLSVYFFSSKKYGKAFIANFLVVIGTMLALFSGLFPNVMVSSIDPQTLSLTINQASSSGYTLGIMTVTALILLPVVLMYQIWTYHVFKKRVEPKDFEY